MIKNYPRYYRMKKFLSYYKPYLELFYADILTQNAPNTINQIYIMGVIMLALIAIHTVCNLFVSYKGHVMGALMERDIRKELFDHYQKLSFNFYDEQKVGKLMSRVTNDSLALAELYHHGPEDLVISLLNFIGAFVILIYINVKLALIAIIFLPIMAAYAFYFNKKMSVALKNSLDRIADINAQVEDTLSGIRVVKSFTNEAIEKEKFDYANNRFLESRRYGYENESYFYEGLVTLTQLMTFSVVLFGGISIVKGSLDLSDLLTFTLYIGILIDPIKKFGNLARLYQEGIAGFKSILEVLQIEPDIQDSTDAVNLTDVQGNIELQDVSFKYKEEYDYVLKNLSLTIKAGEYIALVGFSGVGKTTLCSLISRFYEISGGKILIDGKNIKSVTLNSLRNSIGIVQQDTYLFVGTVAENIGYGKLDATREEIIESAKKANAHDFIISLPNGYDTDIGQRGVKLSGGQKQRLSIARVFLKNPPIIIFDEATSSLDNESEKAVKDSLEKLTKHRTTIVIAHRLSTVKNAQKILVLTNNGIAEQGTHEELITLGRNYAKLYNMQLTL